MKSCLHRGLVLYLIIDIEIYYLHKNFLNCYNVKLDPSELNLAKNIKQILNLNVEDAICYT